MTLAKEKRLMGKLIYFILDRAITKVLSKSQGVARKSYWVNVGKPQQYHIVDSKVSISIVSGDGTGFFLDVHILGGGTIFLLYCCLFLSGPFVILDSCKLTIMLRCGFKQGEFLLICLIFFFFFHSWARLAMVDILHVSPMSICVCDRLSHDFKHGINGDNTNSNINRSNGKRKILECGYADNDRLYREGSNEKAKEPHRVRLCMLRKKISSPRNTKHTYVYKAGVGVVDGTNCMGELRENMAIEVGGCIRITCNGFQFSCKNIARHEVLLLLLEGDENRGFDYGK